MDFTFKIDGAAQMEALLRELPEETSRKVVRGALMAGAAPVVAELERTAPVGRYGPGGVRVEPTPKRQRYGALKDNIKRAVVKTGTASMTVAVGIGRAFWGLLDEFGTRHQPAHPWFRRGWETSKTRALSTIGTALGRGIERAALDLAGRKRTKKVR